MQLFSSFRPLLKSDALLLQGVDKPVALCVGNFDGMHLGHQTIFYRMISESTKNAFKILLTFCPHPRVVLGGANSKDLQLLTPLRTKLLYAKTFKFDAVYLVKFTKKLAELEPNEFLDKYFSRLIKPSVVVVGSDWCFGRGRTGRASTLVEASNKYGFKAVVVDDVCTTNNVRISSTLIRESIQQGELEYAEALLGRKFAIYARVVAGEGRGGKIGFHTANLQISGEHIVSQVPPPNGVYAMYVWFEGNSKMHLGVGNVGIRPTFGENKKTVEVHLINYAGENFYGKRIYAQFIEFIRPEKKFENIEALKKQIEDDVFTVRDMMTD